MYKRRIILTALLAVILLTACNKWLTLSPEDGLIGDSYWSSKEDAKSALMGCYASLEEYEKVNNNTRYVVEQLFLWGEIRADEISLINTNVPDWYKAAFNGDISEDI